MSATLGVSLPDGSVLFGAPSGDPLPWLGGLTADEYRRALAQQCPRCHGVGFTTRRVYDAADDEWIKVHDDCGCPHDPDVAALLDAHRDTAHPDLIHAIERLEFAARLNGSLLIKYRDELAQLKRGKR